MRKLMSLALVLLALTACSAPPEAAQVGKTETLPPLTVQAALPEAPLSYQVQAVEWADSAQAADGSLLAAYCFQLPELTVLRSDGTPLEEGRTPAERQAAAAAETFNAHFGEWASADDFAALAEEAAEELAWSRAEGIAWYGGYTLRLTTDCYQTEHLVSVSGTYCSDAGGAHPNTWRMGWNFDLVSGEFFGPEALAADSAEFQGAMVAELVRQAEDAAAEHGMAASELYWQDYEDILANWSSYAVYFDEEGMTVAFSPYELAPYGFGTQTFTVSYDWLRPHLSQHGREVLDLEG